MGILFTTYMGIPLTITMGFLFTMGVGIQFTVSKYPTYIAVPVTTHLRKM